MCDSTGKEMPQYKCHKIVHALKIKEVIVGSEESVDIYFEDESYSRIHLEGDKAKKFNEPSSDPGYFVGYEGGYCSWSPTEAFEKGYTLITPETTPHDDKPNRENFLFLYKQLMNTNMAIGTLGHFLGTDGNVNEVILLHLDKVSQDIIDKILYDFGFPKDNICEILKQYKVDSPDDLPKEALEKSFCRDYLYDNFCFGWSEKPKTADEVFDTLNKALKEIEDCPIIA